MIPTRISILQRNPLWKPNTVSNPLLATRTPLKPRNRYLHTRLRRKWGWKRAKYSSKLIKSRFTSRRWLHRALRTSMSPQHPPTAPVISFSNPWKTHSIGQKTSTPNRYPRANHLYSCLMRSIKLRWGWRRCRSRKKWVSSETSRVAPPDTKKWSTSPTKVAKFSLTHNTSLSQLLLQQIDNSRPGPNTRHKTRRSLKMKH